jgi:hypothetical protein
VATAESVGADHFVTSDSTTESWAHHPRFERDRYLGELNLGAQSFACVCGESLVVDLAIRGSTDRVDNNDMAR